MTDLRQACDRCHSKKLRCARHPGTNICTRCDRASAPCVFSPPVKPTRSAQQTVSSIDWMASLAMPSPLNFAAEAPVDASTQGSEAQGQQTAMSILATILQSADEVYTSLPGEELFHIPRFQAAQQQAELGQRLNLQNILEQFMGIMQQLDLVYPIILSRASARDVSFWEFCTVEDCVHHTRKPPAPGSRSEHPNQFDYTLVQLLLSSHQRIVDIAEALLEYGSQCYDTAKEMDPQDVRLDIPDVRIGALTVSKPTAASVWMNMLQDSLISLQKRLQTLPDLLAAVRNPAQEEAQIIDLQSRIISRRTETSLEKLTRFRKSLVELNLLTS